MRSCEFVNLLNTILFLVRLPQKGISPKRRSRGPTGASLRVQPWSKRFLCISLFGCNGIVNNEERCSPPRAFMQSAQKTLLGNSCAEEEENYGRLISGAAFSPSSHNHAASFSGGHHRLDRQKTCFRLSPGSSLRFPSYL